MASITHNLNTPLNGLAGKLEEALESECLKQQKKFMKEAQKY